MNQLSTLLGLCLSFIMMLNIQANPPSIRDHNSSPKQNIVLLFVDDLGCFDVGYKGGYFITPSIDNLRSQGVDFSRSYTAISACSPSRAALLTGKNPVRIGMVRHLSNREENKNDEYVYLEGYDPVRMPSRNWMPLSEVTYAEQLKEFGYYNYFIGKWHVGDERFSPKKQGFDDTFGATPAGSPKSYYPPYFDKDYKVLADVSEGVYLTDVLTDNAVDFIKNYDKDQPFSLSFYYYNVHTPQIGRKDLVKMYMEKVHLNNQQAQYAAKVTALDESVGRILKALEEKGIEDQTTIIFTSDQGGVESNAPLRGRKNTPWDDNMLEGGIRIPTIIKVPGMTTANSTEDTPIQTIDLFPTMIQLASGEECQSQDVNGVSLVPLLKGKSISPRKLFFWRAYCNQYANMIDGDWKLMKRHDGTLRMFNLKTDIAERNDLSDDPRYAKQFNKMKQEIKEWEIKNVPEYLKANSRGYQP